MSDLIERQAAIDVERNATVDTNPSHFEAHQKFTQFMDDAEISSFGRWQWSNGFNTALTAVGIDLKKLPSAQPEPLPTASPWHSMEDNGPPEENGPYFVYAPSYRGGSSSEKERARGVMISKWTGKHWSIEVGYYKRPGCVTHWMPIEPPKEEVR